MFVPDPRLCLLVNHIEKNLLWATITDDIRELTIECVQGIPRKSYELRLDFQ
jgi:hypothetical protein